MGSCLYLPAQVLTALRWPRPYSWTDNFISDLGVTACGVYPDPGLPTREICSPWHAVFNTATALSGVLTVMGAVLLTGWWRGRCGRAGTALVALHGSLAALVGLLPWDRHPDAHNAVALWQAVPSPRRADYDTGPWLWRWSRWSDSCCSPRLASRPPVSASGEASGSPSTSPYSGSSSPARRLPCVRPLSVGGDHPRPDQSAALTHVPVSVCGPTGPCTTRSTCPLRT